MEKESLILKIIAILSILYGISILARNYSYFLFTVSNIFSDVEYFGLMNFFFNVLFVFVLPLLFIVGGMALFLLKVWGGGMVAGSSLVIIFIDFYGMFFSVFCPKAVQSVVENGEQVVLAKSLLFQNIMTVVFILCTIYLIRYIKKRKIKKRCQAQKRGQVDREVI